jgi:hypothetical protein
MAVERESRQLEEVQVPTMRTITNAGLVVTAPYSSVPTLPSQDLRGSEYRGASSSRAHVVQFFLVMWKGR